MLWYNGDIKNPVSQAERLSVIPEGRKRDEESIFGCYCSDRGPCRRTYAQLHGLPEIKKLWKLQRLMWIPCCRDVQI